MYIINNLMINVFFFKKIKLAIFLLSHTANTLCKRIFMHYNLRISNFNYF